MTKPKKTEKADPPTPGPSDGKTAATNAPAPAVTPSGTGANAAPAPGRRALGAKETIPFAWKLVGETHDAALTLFKAVEREEVDAHLDRVAKEGYYKNLRVLEVDTKVMQPKVVPAPRTAGKRAKKAPRKTAERAGAKPKSVARDAGNAVKPTRKAAQPKRTAKKSSSCGATKPATKAPAKTSTKKTAAAKSAATRRNRRKKS